MAGLDLGLGEWNAVGAGGRLGLGERQERRHCELALCEDDELFLGPKC